jgi:hypothetical protein
VGILEPMRCSSGSGWWRTPSSWASNVSPVPPHGRRRRSRRSTGSWCRWPDEFSAMRGRWSCDSCWVPRRSPVGIPSTDDAGRWARCPDVSHVWANNGVSAEHLDRSVSTRHPAERMGVGSRNNRESGFGFSRKRAPGAQRKACSSANRDLRDFYLWIWGEHSYCGLTWYISSAVSG